MCSGATDVNRGGDASELSSGLAKPAQSTLLAAFDAAMDSPTSKISLHRAAMQIFCMGNRWLFPCKDDEFRRQKNEKREREERDRDAQVVDE